MIAIVPESLYRNPARVITREPANDGLRGVVSDCMDLCPLADYRGS
jgi:hypothetical protein